MISIINADVFDGLAQLENESVQCVVTSPPYWGLRDYGVKGQIGLEATPEAFVEKMVAVFREVKRVLRSDGVLFLNIGDSYCNTDKWGGGGQGNNGKHTLAPDGSVPSWAVRRRREPIQGIKPKDLIGMPWMVAFALRADGWYLRQEIIWAKPNPMPESVRDRCTKAHEHIFLLSKSKRYFFDAEAIKEDSVTNDPRRPYGSPGANALDPRGAQGMGKVRAPANVKRGDFKGKTNQLPGREAFRAFTETRNKRSVWTIATRPYSEAHFATFPPALPTICIKAGSRPGDTILDPFGGAGTTGLIAKELGRNAILIELNSEYAAMAQRRIQAGAA